MKKRIFSALLISALAVSALTACGGSSSAKKSGQTLTVLNYGKYIDESVVKQFEKETGITVKYEEYESPEEMYTKYKAGSIDYDLLCTSDYMIEKLIDEGEVQKMDYTKNQASWTLLYKKKRNLIDGSEHILYDRLKKDEK